MYPAAPRMGFTALVAEQETPAPRADCARAMPVTCIAEDVQIVTGRQNSARHIARIVGVLGARRLALVR